MNEMGNSNENVGDKELIFTLATYLFVLLLKLIAYFATGFFVLLAEAYHTLTDILISVFLLISSKFSKKDPDEEHNFGHGRTQYIASLVASILFISFTSYELFSEAIPRLIVEDNVSSTENPHLAIIIVIVSFALNFLPVLYIMRSSDKSPTIKTQLKELFNDQIGLLAALVGIILTHNKYHIADPIAAMVVATIIAYNGVILFRENFSYLLGKSPGAEFISEITDIALVTQGVINVHDIKAMHIGPNKINLQMHIEVNGNMTVQEANQIIRNIITNINEVEEFKGVYCIIHTDPVINESSDS